MTAPPTSADAAPGAEGGREVDVVVIGGGLAGITAALRCADAGRRVTLLEARPYLGGLTYSFRRGELDVDNGQHVFLRCCTAYRSLLERLGVTDKVHLQPRLEIPVRSSALRRPARLRRNGLPAPLHLGNALLRYTPLSLAERLRFLTAALALKRVDPNTADQRSFGDWLRAHGQSEHAVAALWDLVGVATLNATADHASLALAATVFQIGLLTEAPAADIGWSLVPLRELHDQPARDQLHKAGATTLTGRKAELIEREGPRWRVRASGEDSMAEQVVLAVPPGQAERLLPADSLPQPAGWSGRLGNAPIVNVHVVYDRKVVDGPFFAAVDSPLQWVFDRTTHSGLSSGQYLAISLSAADAYVDLPVATLRGILLPELERLLPAARTARVLDFFVTRERRATFRPAPGSSADRSPARTSHPGLWLAGAWTSTGWPATMESAVLSGEAAAAGVLSCALLAGATK
jgi:squalene-associated FAD-dependent desaturase